MGKSENEIEFSLNGKIVNTKILKSKVYDLDYFSANPRVASIIVDLNHEPTNEEIDDIMFKKQPDATRTLYQEIKKDGMVNEPLIVWGKKVIEGNTRLWVVRQLIKDGKTQEEQKKWQMVSTRVIQDNLSKEDINVILCDYHIKKKRDWDPFEQACYYYRMSVEEKITNQKIKEITGVNANKIGDYIMTYKNMVRVRAGVKDFNLHYEAIRQPAVKKAIQDGVDIPQIIQKKKKDGKINRAEDVRKLTTILKDKAASKKFIGGDVDINRAEQIAIRRNPEEGDRFLKEISDLTEDIENLPINKIEEIQNDKKKLKIIIELIKKIKKLSRTLKLDY